MASRAYQAIGYTGVNIAYAAAEGLDTIPPNGRGFLHVKNGGGGSTNVGVIVPGTTQGQAHPDIVVAVTAGAERLIGPLPNPLGDNGGNVLTTFSVLTSVTVAYINL